MPYPTGDLNQDGIVDSIDISILVSNWNTSDPTSDINNDGIVDSLDLSILVSNWGETTADAGTALLVTNDETLSMGHQNLSNILTTAGYTVATRLFSDPEDYDGIDVVIVSIGNPQGDTGKYINPPVGIVTMDSWRPLGMGTNLGFENNTNPVEVIAPSNPLAAGVSGTFDAYLAPRFITWETDLSANPTVVVTRPSQPTQAVVFAYESGDTMTSRFATTRHVALGYHEDGLEAGLSTEATDQLLAATAWAAASSYTAPPPPSAPTNVVASASNEQATISWDSVSSADSYTIKRSTTDGGPYTTIETNITTTSYTDINLTNGTTYYYVISATNAQGESQDSSQVSATPVENTLLTLYRINSGGDEIANDGENWHQDGADELSPWTETGVDLVETVPVAVTKSAEVPAYVPVSLFESLRWRGGSSYLRYRLPHGTGDHILRLYFCEREHTIAGGRQFHVSVDGTQVLTNFDIAAEAGGQGIGIMREFSLDYTSNGDTLIEILSASVDAPVINGVELLGANLPPAPSAPTLSAQSGVGYIDVTLNY